MSTKNSRKDKQLADVIHRCQKMVYDNNDGNTIQNQLSNIAFSDAIYRSFNEGLRLDKENDSRPKLLIDQYHEMFYKNQAISLRRVLDKREDAFSLRCIFENVNSNRLLYTRRGFISANREQIDRIAISRMQDNQIEFYNQQYDLLSNKNSNTRNDDDVLFYPYLDAIETYLNKNKLIHVITNEYIAHSVSEGKRKTKKDELAKATLLNLQRVYRDISWLSYSISRYISKLILFKIPSVPYNQFEGWVGSIYKKQIERSLNAYWDKRVALFDSWEKKYWFGNRVYITPYTCVN